MAAGDAAGTSHRAGDLRRAAAPMHEPAMVSAQPVAGGLGGATGSRGAVRCLTGGGGGGGDLRKEKGAEDVPNPGGWWWNTELNPRPSSEQESVLKSPASILDHLAVFADIRRIGCEVA